MRTGFISSLVRRQSAIQLVSPFFALVTLGEEQSVTLHDSRRITQLRCPNLSEKFSPLFRRTRWNDFFEMPCSARDGELELYLGELLGDSAEFTQKGQPAGSIPEIRAGSVKDICLQLLAVLPAA